MSHMPRLQGGSLTGMTQPRRKRVWRVIAVIVIGCAGVVVGSGGELERHRTRGYRSAATAKQGMTIQRVKQ